MRIPPMIAFDWSIRRSCRSFFSRIRSYLWGVSMARLNYITRQLESPVEGEYNSLCPRYRKRGPQVGKC